MSRPSDIVEGRNTYRWRLTWVEPDGEESGVSCDAGIAEYLMRELVAEGTPPEDIRLERRAQR